MFSWPQFNSWMIGNDYSSPELLQTWKEITSWYDILRLFSYWRLVSNLKWTSKCLIGKFFLYINGLIYVWLSQKGVTQIQFKSQQPRIFPKQLSWYFHLLWSEFFWSYGPYRSWTSDIARSFSPSCWSRVSRAGCAVFSSTKPQKCFA